MTAPPGHLLPLPPHVPYHSYIVAETLTLTLEAPESIPLPPLPTVPSLNLYLF